MAEARVSEILRYYEDLRGKRSHWENHWQEVADHSIGRRTFNIQREPGRQRQQHIYDTTSRDANTLLAAALHSLLTNPATRWFDLRFQDQALNEDDEAVFWLDAAREQTQSAFRRPDSAFTTNMHEFYVDLSAFGTAGLFVADEMPGARFSSRPLAELYIDEDASGRITVVARCFKLKAWQAVKEFGEGNVPKADNVVRTAPNTELEFLHLVRQREQPLPGRIDAAGMPWESLTVSIADKQIVREKGFHENPFLVARWSKDSGELYGRGPGIDTVPDQKMLNAMWRTFIRNAEKAADPPLLVEDDSVLPPGRRLRIAPSAQITVRNEGGGSIRDKVVPLETGARLELPPQMIEMRRLAIQKAFHSEIIQAFMDPRMTATQVIELARLSQRILSPVLGRMQVEVLEPMIERVFAIEARAGRLPEIPEFLFGADLRVEYVSPVARAQKASEAQAILDSFASAAAVSQVDPSVMDNIDLDEAIRKVFEGNGVPVKVLRSRREVATRRQAQARVLAEEEAQARLLAAGETAAKLIPAVSGALQPRERAR